MEAFAERSVDVYFEFSTLQFFIVLFLSGLISVIFGVAFTWHVGLGVGFGVFFLLYAVLGKCRCSHWFISIYLPIFYLSLFLYATFLQTLYSVHL